jgi:hypothetical protein
MKQFGLSATMPKRKNLHVTAEMEDIQGNISVALNQRGPEAKYVFSPTTSRPYECLHMSIACNFITTDDMVHNSFRESCELRQKFLSSI